MFFLLQEFREFQSRLHIFLYPARNNWVLFIPFLTIPSLGPRRNHFSSTIISRTMFPSKDICLTERTRRLLYKSSASSSSSFSSSSSSPPPSSSHTPPSSPPPSLSPPLFLLLLLLTLPLLLLLLLPPLILLSLLPLLLLSFILLQIPCPILLQDDFINCSPLYPPCYLFVFFFHSDTEYVGSLKKKTCPHVFLPGISEVIAQYFHYLYKAPLLDLIMDRHLITLSQHYFFS